VSIDSEALKKEVQTLLDQAILDMISKLEALNEKAEQERKAEIAKAIQAHQEKASEQKESLLKAIESAKNESEFDQALTALEKVEINIEEYAGETTDEHKVSAEVLNFGKEVQEIKDAALKEV